MEKAQGVPADHPRDPRQECAASALGSGKLLKLPGGVVYYQDAPEIDLEQEGANLQQLQTRQGSFPLFSKKARSVMVFF